MVFCNLPAQGKADARAVRIAGKSLERLKNLLCVFLIKSRAIVSKLDLMEAGSCEQGTVHSRGTDFDNGAVA